MEMENVVFCREGMGGRRKQRSRRGENGREAVKSREEEGS